MDVRREVLRSRGIPEEQIDRMLGPEEPGPLSMSSAPSPAVPRQTVPGMPGTLSMGGAASEGMLPLSSAPPRRPSPLPMSPMDGEGMLPFSPSRPMPPTRSGALPGSPGTLSMSPESPYGAGTLSMERPSPAALMGPQDTPNPRRPFGTMDMLSATGRMGIEDLSRTMAGARMGMGMFARGSPAAASPAALSEEPPTAPQTLTGGPAALMGGGEFVGPPAPAQGLPAYYSSRPRGAGPQMAAQGPQEEMDPDQLEAKRWRDAVINNREGELDAEKKVEDDEAAWQAKRDSLQNWRDVAEGLGNMNLTSGAEIRSGVSGRRPFVAEGIRQKQAEMAAGVTPREAARYGATVGTPRDAVPGLSGYGYRRDTLGLRERGLELGEANLAQRKEGDKRRDMLAKRLPSKQRDSLIGYQKALTELDIIGRKAETAQFGPIAGRWNQFARKIGLGDPDTIASAAALINAVNQTIYQSTGKQLNEEEMKRITATMPAVWDSPATFNTVLQEVKERIARQMKLELKGYRGAYDTSDFDDEEDEAPGLAAPSADGKTGPIPAAATPTAAGGKIEVRMKVATGTRKAGDVGFIRADAFDPSIHERVSP